MPEENLLGERGGGFVIAQDRLGPGRIHHCMRAIGAAERAIELMCKRANTRVSFGSPLGEKQFVQDFVAKSRIEIDSARLMVLHAAWKMDTAGKRAARQEISMIKVQAAQMCMEVIDRAIQVHGALGVSDDTPLAAMWRGLRMLRLADGPGRGAQDGDRAEGAEPLEGDGMTTALATEQQDFIESVRNFCEREKDLSFRETTEKMAELGWWGLDDRRGVRRLGGHVRRRVALPRGDLARALARRRRLRRHADRRRRAQLVRHRGAEGGAARRGREERQLPGDRDVGARGGVGRRRAQDARRRARTASTC